MTVLEMIELLEIMYKEYGNVDVVGADDYDIDFVEPQKYVKVFNDFHGLIERHTEDLDEDFLDRNYVNNPKYNEHVKEKGTCIKIF